MKRIITILITFYCSGVLSEQEMTPAELEKWFNEDDTPSSSSSIQVDKGQLVFLSKLPDKPPLHSVDEITIDSNSIDNGWVKFEQCYRQLDPIGKVDVIYSYRFMRDLQISSVQHIGAAWIRKQRIELEDVKKDAELCVKAEIRVFYQNPDKSFSLVNGPYLRKYLDGYFPYHVTLIVHYPENRLELIGSLPVEQAGFKINKEKNKLLIDTIFSGTLNTEIIFREIKQAAQ